jgi:dephospho-CoA kinase
VYLVGLTGGIASGKSSVAKHWVELGGIEIDADVLARKALEPGSEGLEQVIAAFGEHLRGNDGALNREALAQLVFNDPDTRAKLEAIVHPIVRKLASEAISKLPDDSIVIYTVPLLVEANVDLPFDLVVTVEAPQEKQIERMVKHRGMSIEDAKARIQAQASSAQRANRADVILNSNQSYGRLLDDAETLWRTIESKAQQK